MIESFWSLVACLFHANSQYTTVYYGGHSLFNNLECLIQYVMEYNFFYHGLYNNTMAKCNNYPLYFLLSWSLYLSLISCYHGDCFTFYHCENLLPRNLIGMYQQ